MNEFLDPKNHVVNFCFNCFVCGVKFKLYLGYIARKNSVNCPNCDQELPDEIFADLKQSIEKLESALVKLQKLNTYDKGWNVSLFWSEYNKLPERPGSLDEFIVGDPESYKPFKVENPKSF